MKGVAQKAPNIPQSRGGPSASEGQFTYPTATAVALKSTKHLRPHPTAYSLTITYRSVVNRASFPYNGTGSEIVIAGLGSSLARPTLFLVQRRCTQIVRQLTVRQRLAQSSEHLQRF